MAEINITLETDGEKETLVIDAETAATLERYRAEVMVELKEETVTHGNGMIVVTRNVPRYATLAALIKDVLIERLIVPAMEQFPTPALLGLKAQLAAAEQALRDARAGGIQ